MLLVLLLMLVAVRNCPAGLCLLSLLLTAALVVFALLPLVYTATIIGLRDGCANVELIARGVRLQARVHAGVGPNPGFGC